MERRSVLSGTGLALATSIAGCLDTIGDEPTSATAGTTSASACEAGRAVLEAIGNEEYETAAAYYPTALEESGHGPSPVDRYRTVRTPDGIGDIECGEATSDPDLETQFSEWIDGDVGTAKTIQYTADVDVGSVSIETTSQVGAVEIDGDWYAWLDSELVPRPNAGVTVDEDGLETATVTYTSGSDGVSVYITGDGIDDPTAYRLESPGASTTVAAPDLPPGRYEVVAAREPYDEDVATTEVAVFELVDRDAWRDVDEIVFSAETVAWVGRAPDHVEGVENPTLVLEAGRTYRIGWDRGNGQGHNFEVHDAAGTVVDDYETELAIEPDDDQFLTVTATEELSTYRCRPHTAMSGAIEVVDEL
ncbi:plastocyanin [Halovivax cerinus]|uniref:Plastocyanin n=1 Tax=Halovivax cerinus TaxID=1487865 RepID=A0ABD5NJN1_9EURY|nr:plastocyanin [Halovivax cerinus]